MEPFVCFSWMCTANLPAERAGLRQTRPCASRDSSAQSTGSTLDQSTLAAQPEAEEEKTIFPVLSALVWIVHLHGADCSHQLASDHSFSHIGFCQLSGGKILSNGMCKSHAGKCNFQHMVGTGVRWAASSQCRAVQEQPWHGRRRANGSLGGSPLFNTVLPLLTHLQVSGPLMMNGGNVESPTDRNFVVFRGALHVFVWKWRNRGTHVLDHLKCLKKGKVTAASCAYTGSHLMTCFSP